MAFGILCSVRDPQASGTDLIAPGHDPLKVSRDQMQMSSAGVE
jgi:hypothetical protein